MSALPPKADIQPRERHVRYVPKADSCTAAKIGLFDYVGGYDAENLTAPARSAALIWPTTIR
jgi:hypothetical protein